MVVQLAIVVFFGLFAIVEIYQSVKNVQLPMPVYLVLGITLAVVSNLSVLSQSKTIAAPLPIAVNLLPPEEAQIIARIE
jgi:hypothetical protein